MRALLLLALLTATPARASEHDWALPDTVMEVGFASLVFLDWQQTRWALRQDPRLGYYEGNPLLGKRPSLFKLDTLAAAGVAGHACIAYLLPQPYRAVWQLTFVVVEIKVVAVNAGFVGGLRFSF